MMPQRSVLLAVLTLLGSLTGPTDRQALLHERRRVEVRAGPIGQESG